MHKCATHHHFDSSYLGIVPTQLLEEADLTQGHLTKPELETSTVQLLCTQESVNNGCGSLVLLMFTFLVHVRAIQTLNELDKGRGEPSLPFKKNGLISYQDWIWSLLAPRQLRRG